MRVELKMPSVPFGVARCSAPSQHIERAAGACAGGLERQIIGLNISPLDSEQNLRSGFQGHVTAASINASGATGPRGNVRKISFARAC